MLSRIKNAKAKARKIQEALYEDRVDIIEYQKKIKANKSTGYEETAVICNQPCSLHVIRNVPAQQTDTAAVAAQTIMLHIAPEIVIKPNSKLIVTHKKVSTEYKNSGVPASYDTHQEVMLEKFRGWA